MVYLITGGAGFIGSHFILYLLSKYENVRIVCIDKLTYAANPATLAPVMSQPNFRFVKADICDRKTVYRIFEEEHPDIAVNFAAESHVDRSIENPSIFMQTNVIGTSVLLDACLKYGVRLHQVSTDEVYGDLPLDRPGLKFSETDPFHPNNPYSASKASADLMVLTHHHTYGLPITISRSSNNYGSHQHPEKLIPHMIFCAIQHRPLPIYGNGLNVREWIHVDDHCRAIDLILQNGIDGEIYNVGGQCEMRNIDIVRMICTELRASEELITHVADRKGHDRRYALDCTKIRQDFDWQPTLDFSKGLHDTVRWYQQNIDWLTYFQ